MQEYEDLPDDVRAAAEACYVESEQLDSYGIIATIGKLILDERRCRETDGRRTIESLVEPIESAPKDGTVFWGIVRGDAIAVFWHEGFGEFISSYRRMTLAPGLTWEDGKTYHDHSPVIHRPMSWLPKPKLPDTEDT
ncbi:hypothetical protein GFL93_12670 [Rhizobium leguminosarum bv. viciae]|uniref:hypothetical protein n=2 Tax=Rhizobium TaxID=379 RepID=UPI0014420AA8|nr:hypothetical protein [Rhizobium leguminosarum]NKK06714.1 hypothetical protein [Rhizobium leguminosarum bv. viciae]